MHPHLRKLERELLRSVAGLSASQTQAAPSHRPDAWSLQQIVEHLLLTHKATISILEERVSKGRPVQTPVTLRHKAAQLMVISLRQFPRGVQAPVSTVASPIVLARSGEELARRISGHLSELDEVCAKAEGIFGAQRSVTHFRLGPLSIAQWRKFHLVHGLHHVAQITAIRRDHAFGSEKAASARAGRDRT